MDRQGAIELKPGQSATGYVPAVDFVGPELKQQKAKAIHWSDSALIGEDNTPNPQVWEGDVPQHVFEQMQASLPKQVRRTARQRHEVLIQRLLDIGKACPVVAGQIVWPQSLKSILDTTGVVNNEDLIPQVFALAKHFAMKSENEQRAADRKNFDPGWHQHYD